MTRRLQWQPDDGSAAILAAYARRRALRLLTRADGLLDHRGRVVVERRQGRQP